VRALPKTTPIVLSIPHVDVLLADLQSLLEVLRVLDPDTFPESLGELFARMFGFDKADGAALRSSDGDGQDNPPSWARLFRREGLESIGVDVSGSAMVAPNLIDDAIVVGFNLKSRTRFEQWLGRLAHGEARRVEIAGEQASVFGPSRDVPITCLSRQSIAFCQIGVSSGSDPVAELRMIVQRSSPTLGEEKAVMRPLERLPEGAHADLLINAEPFSRTIGLVTQARAQRDHRFDGKDAKRAAEQEEKTRVQKLRRWTEPLEGAAIGLYPERDAIAIKTELSFTDRGAKNLRDLAARDPKSDLIERWTDTPAIARVLMRMDPEHAARLFESLGWAVPKDALSGTVGLLLFGIDTECPLAKKSADKTQFGWAFLLPSALAVGIRSTESGSAVHDALASAIAKEAPSGGAFDIRVLDDLVFVGTGPGSGAAAVRRVNGLPPPHTAKSTEATPFLEGSIHLRAVDAALESGDYGADRRKELVMLDAFRHRMKPLLEQIASLSFAARAMEPEHRMRVDVELKR
jgi:hypothetical protein